MKRSIAIAILVNVVVVGASMAASSATIKIKNGALFYDGMFTKQDVAKAIAVYEAQKIKPTLLTIRSGGGDVEAGLTFGEFIHKHQLSVRVQDYCASSCANYVFTAGKEKYLSPASIVMWHGSAIQKSWGVSGTVLRFSCDSDESCSEEQARHAVGQLVPECGSPQGSSEERCIKLVNGTKSQVLAVIERQHAFFNAIGVDERVTVYGHDIQCRCEWTFSVDDMRKFNIQNVTRDERKPSFREAFTFAAARARTLTRKTRTLQLPEQF